MDNFNGITHADMVNHPAHYTAGKFEAIDVIEDAVAHAPNAVIGALLWQSLKYLLRMFLKGKPLEDAKKARWYLNRMINKLEADEGVNVSGVPYKVKL